MFTLQGLFAAFKDDINYDFNLIFDQEDQKKNLVKPQQVLPTCTR